MRSHNIVGSEASERERLVAFSHAHGSMVVMPRRARAPLLPLLTFLAGVAIALTAAALITSRI